MKKFLLSVCIGTLLLTACSKKKADDPASTSTTVNNGADSPPATGSTLDKIRDSIYLYAKEDYYWNDAIPSYSTFNPRGYTSSTSDLDALTKEVFAISQLKTNPNTGRAYEYNSSSPTSPKYSFIDEGEVSNKLSAVTGDFGFDLGYIRASSTSSSSDLRIILVYPGSPADKAGIKRGYRVTKMNNQTDLSNTQANVNFIINAYTKSSSITLTLLKPDGTSFDVSMNTASYQINPIFAAKVLDLGTKKIGYIALSNFVLLANVQAGLDAAFSSFSSAGVSAVVVDLRYNGGGYVQTAQYLDNLLAPSSANGKLMFTSYYNSNLTNHKATLLRNQVRKGDDGKPYNYYDNIDYSVAANQEVFSKKGSLNINDVFFIVSGSTASASELTLNNLLPYMNVQIIGSKTYGKPVGFFDIQINKYYMYIPEFETKNASGNGGYYDGITPATTGYPGMLAADDYSKDWGDVTENMLSQAVNYVTKGKFSTPTLQVESNGANGSFIDPLRQQSINRKFNDMIMEKKKLNK